MVAYLKNVKDMPSGAAQMTAAASYFVLACLFSVGRASQPKKMAANSSLRFGQRR